MPSYPTHRPVVVPLDYAERLPRALPWAKRPKNARHLRLIKRLVGKPRNLNVTPFAERLVLYCRRNGNRIIYSLLGFVGLCVAAIAGRWAL